MLVAAVAEKVETKKSVSFPSVSFACLLFLAFAAPCAAQSGDQGSIEGIVTDRSGAVVTGVELKARNQDTSATVTANTNEDGLFRFPVLALGMYELTAERPGFATLILKNVVVTVGAHINLPLSLGVATKSETVVVSGSVPVIETTRSQVSATVGERTIEGLPVNGRDFTSFALLTPGVTRDVRGGLSFAGQRAMNSLLVDGVDDDDPWWGQAQGGTGFVGVYQFSQDAVQEFQVNSNSYSAELGRAGGGVVNAVTKSGTNHFHGTGFWYYRDQSMNANDPVNKLNGQPKSPFHFNQFGGALGGPIVKNRLFFFTDYEGERSTTPNTVFLNLPNGFRVSSDTKIADSQQKALDYLTARAASWVRPFVQNDYIAKFDWHIAPTHSLTGRWNCQRWTGALPAATGAKNSFEHGGTSLLNTDTLALSLTSTLSTSKVNVARFSYGRSASPFLLDSVNPEANVFEGGQLVLAVGRNQQGKQDIQFQRGQWSDTVSSVRGRHTLKTGGDILLDRVRFFTAQNFSGSYVFSSLESFGESLAGSPARTAGESYLQSFSGDSTPGSTTHPDILEFAAFMQDEWRLSPNLTFNLGVRYDLQLIAQPPVRNPSPALATAGLDTSFLRTDKKDFAPRLGFAWTPLPNNRLVVRGGYGIFYARTPSLMTGRAHFQNGVSVQTRTFEGGKSSAGLIPAYPNSFCGPPDPSGAPPTCAAPATGVSNPIIMLFSPQYRQPYIQQGSFGVEVQFEKDLALSVSYLVAKGTHLQFVRDINLGLPTTRAQIGIARTNTVLSYQKFTLPRPIPGFDRVLEFDSSGNSIYHGLAVRLNKRFAHNFQFLCSYTFGKVIDDNPNVYALNPGPGGDAGKLSDPSNPRADRSAGANDQSHRFVLSGIWDLDYANQLPRIEKGILRGWQLSGILTAQSGQPYSGLVNFDLNNDGNPFTDRTPGLGRNTFYAPHAVSLDPRLTRSLRLNEHAKLQFIWEAFNVFNRANITGVRTTQFSVKTCGTPPAPCLLVPQNTGLTAFGTPTATSGPRIMQLSAKLVF